MSLPIKIPVIYHGEGALDQLKNFKENRILIVTDKTISKLYGAQLLSYFEKKEVKIFDEVEPDPKDTAVIKGGDVARKFEPELIVGIGGGSAMDTAKGIYFLYGQESLKLYDMAPLIEYDLSKKSKLVLIPTTSGTGSENSPGLVVTKTDSDQKVSLASYDLIPSAIILDPKLPLNMPKKLTVSTGLDALTQAIESAINKMGNDFTQALNLYGIKTLFKYLPLAIAEGASDVKIRGKIHNVASMIGIAFGNSALGLAHACGHALGGVYHIQHGTAVSLMLPYVIEFSKPASEEKYVEILECLSVTDVKDPTEKLSSMLKELYKKLGSPLNIKELGISEKDWKQNFEKLINFTKAEIVLYLNPRVPAEGELNKIFQYAYEGKKIDF